MTLFPSTSRSTSLERERPGCLVVDWVPLQWIHMIPIYSDCVYLSVILYMCWHCMLYFAAAILFGEMITICMLEDTPCDLCPAMMASSVGDWCFNVVNYSAIPLHLNFSSGFCRQPH